MFALVGGANRRRQIPRLLCAGGSRGGTSLKLQLGGGKGEEGLEEGLEEEEEDGSRSKVYSCAQLRRKRQPA